MTTATASKTQWAKPEDWEKYRNTITALFMCHSLPVVIRVMREEHKFYATPKMFQSQIYQKWGLRKTKPGEAKKEAKERKRRREESEDVESIASSTRTRGPTTAETMSVSGRSYASTSPQTSAAAWQAQPDDLPVVKDFAKAPSSQQAGDYDDSRSVVTAADSQAGVPNAWSDFHHNGHGPNNAQSGGEQITAAAVEPGPQVESEYAIHTRGMLASSNDSDSWISTVMIPSRTNSAANLHSRVSPSDKSPGSRSSPKSRTSRTPSGREDAMSSSQNAKRLRTMAAINRPMGYVRHLESPAALLAPERSMFYARHYISSTFSTGLWALSQSTDPGLLERESGSLGRWYNDFNPAFDFLREQKVRRAFRLLKKCFANTKTIIEPQDPRVVIYVCQQAIRCMFYDTIGRNLSQTLLKYIAGLCHVMFGVEHPLYIMLIQLSRMGSFEFAQNMRPFMDCYFDHLEPFLEKSTNAFRHITEMRGLTISLMEATGMMGIYEAKPIMDGLVRKAEAYGISSLHMKVETAALLQRNRFFPEALSLLAEVRESEEAETSPYEYVYAGIMLMLTYRKMKDSESAANVGYELAEFLSKPPTHYPGLPDEPSMSVRQYTESRSSSLLLVLGKLEKDLRDAGRYDEADQIKAKLDSGVAQRYGIEGADEDPEAEVAAMV